MTDQELKDLVAGLATAQAKTEILIAKTDVQLEKTTARVDKLAKMYGGIAHNQGDVAEEFFYNSLGGNPILKGIKFDFVDKNITRSYAGIEDEYDLLLTNGSEVFIIEVKYKAHWHDLERLLKKKAPNFRKLFPAYRDFKHHLAIASFHINDDLKSAALERGVSILQRKGDLIETSFANENLKET
jgi:hypothetical protein